MNRIGRYEILEELGRGAMGAVYKARDPQIGRTVALKIILTANLSKPDLEHFKQRFYREAQTAGQMAHPGIVTIHDIAEDEKGQPYLVMEYVDGTTLEKLLMPSGAADRYALRVGSETFPVWKAVDLGIQLAEALDYAHRRGVIHRDIKPSNILVFQEGAEGARRLRAKIADFGIAKVAGTGLTQTGMVMGTPAFMSPEQVSMTGLDARSDLFSLGGVLYWMFTGEKPFPGETLTQITFKVVFGAPLPAAYVNPKLPPDLDVILSRCLAKNPDDRYSSARELAGDLELVKAGKPLETTAAPLADMTVMQTNPLPAVAAGLPPEKRPPQSPGPHFTDSTVHVGSQKSEHVVGQAQPTPTLGKESAPPAAPGKVVGRKLLFGAGVAAVVVVVLGYFLIPRKSMEPPEQRPAATAPQPAAVPSAAPATSTAPPESVALPPPPLPEPNRTDESLAAKAKASEAYPAAKTAKQPESSGTTAATPGKEPESPVAEKKSPAGPATAKPTARGNLQIECRNNFDQATLTITVDGRVLLKEPLVDKKPLIVVRPVGVGQHAFVVQVTSEKDKFDQRQEIRAKFGMGETHQMVIEFGRLSGLGIRGRKLSVKWSK